jgi:inner membrane protein
METVQQTTSNLLERFNRWIQESIMVKLFSIGFLILILLIPSAWIEHLMYERQQRATEVIDEVADKWSGNQTLAGPVLIIPYKKQVVIDKGKDGKEVSEFTEKAFFLPNTLDITGKLKPEILKRGIFDAVVYGSSLQVNSSFDKPDFKSLAIPESMVLWDQAYLVMGITDHRGINGNPTFKVGDEALPAEPTNNIGIIVRKSFRPASGDYTDETTTTPDQTGNGIIIKPTWTSAENFNGNVSISLDLRGSKRLDFVPTGKTTDVKLQGDWNNPSFDGEFLPITRTVSEKEFSATWKILHFNRPFSQQWTENNKELSGADFGVKLLIPVDQYQKSIRTAKYGVLIILLTFMALFLVEITQKIRIHPFQYILIGAALIIYYTLLLSFSERLGYDLAYLISSAATIILISLYSTTFFTSTRLAILFSGVLTLFYAFIYVIILEQDFSLMFGSIGLFLIVAAIMYFSRKVRWYKEVAQ